MLAYHASRDAVPLYAVYALLFADHGLSAGQISSLFVIWSVTAFVAEVPSGAWADTVDRRHLLVVSALLHAAAFAAWTWWPDYAGFALGFVLWGVSGALMSGTFEALLYDDLAVRGESARYPRLIGYARSSALVCTLLAELAAVPLLFAGGYQLVGVASVGMALVQGLLAATLPVTRSARHGRRDPDDDSAGYVAMLRAGLSEASRTPSVRRALLVASVLVGTTAYDEFFPVVADAHGVAATTVPVLVSLATLAQAVGTALAGRTARMGPRTLAAVVAGGAALISLGVLVHPYAGFVAIALGYGLLNNAMIVAETRLQDSIQGPARATVTSVLGVGEETVALMTYAFVGLGSGLIGVPVAVALVGLPLVAGAVTGHLMLVHRCWPGVCRPGLPQTPRAACTLRRPCVGDPAGAQMRDAGPH
ncbi:Major Facilitator Superfamily protein [Nocardioides sp. YR527]|uniref:MFS transporter n=1 Tax=Nocardioides sp. YR527 TaxID=1881028 RepID=UPI0008878AED|nr:MFS transporter [Nocardioides sp. YR527]SDL26304.1 Major Facilitator Superfamily protein [Nocardioides sp. YR527]